MFDPETSALETAIAPSADAGVRDLIRLIVDAKNSQARLDAITAASAKLRDARADCERAAKVRAASLDEREAAIAKREAELSEAEEGLANRKDEVDARYFRINEASAMVQRQSELLKRRLMNYAGIVQQPLQADFSFEQVENLLHGRRTDAHYDGSEGTSREHGTGATVPPENLIAGSTLTRASQDKTARKSMRRGVE
jgi:hypothetical protein